MLHYTLSADGIELTDKLAKYIEKKVKPLEKYVPKSAQKAMTLDIHFRLIKKNHAHQTSNGSTFSRRSVNEAVQAVQRVSPGGEKRADVEELDSVSGSAVEQVERSVGHDEKEVKFILVLPHEKIVIKEATTHAYASLDVIMVEVKRRLRSYKEKHEPKSIRHRIARAKRKLPKKS